MTWVSTGCNDWPHMYPHLKRQGFSLSGLSWNNLAIISWNNLVEPSRGYGSNQRGSWDH